MLLAGDIIFWGCVFIFFIEQILCYSLLSFPYKYGFVIKRIKHAKYQEWKSYLGKKSFKKLVTKVRLDRNEIFFYYKYPIGLGPILFTAP